MKIKLILLQLICIIQIEFSQNTKSFLETLPKYPLKSIKQYCQHDSIRCVSEILFYYNEKNQLVKSVSCVDTINKFIHEFEYQSNGLLSSTNFYEYSLTKKLMKGNLQLPTIVHYKLFQRNMKTI